MAPAKLETEDHSRDAAFNKALHKDSSTAQGGFSAMLKKDKVAQKAAVDEYFKHWDNKAAKDETPEIIEVGWQQLWNWAQNVDTLPTGTQSRIRYLDQTVSFSALCFADHLLILSSYYNLVTDLYEYGWGQSFHFCRFAYGEPFRQAIARHEHYLATKIGIKDGYKVLDVGCGVGGPAREIAKFTGAHITGLNNNDYQIDRATLYAKKEGLSDQLAFVKGDFMVCLEP
jgi:sterol 24-C-methyltransferase